MKLEIFEQNSKCDIDDSSLNEAENHLNNNKPLINHCDQFLCVLFLHTNRQMPVEQLVLKIKPITCSMKGWSEYYSFELFFSSTFLSEIGGEDVKNSQNIQGGNDRKIKLKQSIYESINSLNQFCLTFLNFGH